MAKEEREEARERAVLAQIRRMERMSRAGAPRVFERSAVDRGTLLHWRKASLLCKRMRSCCCERHLEHWWQLSRARGALTPTCMVAVGGVHRGPCNRINHCTDHTERTMKGVCAGYWRPRIDQHLVCAGENRTTCLPPCVAVIEYVYNPSSHHQVLICVDLCGAGGVYSGRHQHRSQ